MPHGKSPAGKGGNRSLNHAVNIFSCKCGWTAKAKTTSHNRDVDSRDRRLVKKKVELHRKYCEVCEDDDREVVYTDTSINWREGRGERVRQEIVVPEHLTGIDRARAYISALHHLNSARADLQ